MRLLEPADAPDVTSEALFHSRSLAKPGSRLVSCPPSSLPGQPRNWLGSRSSASPRFAPSTPLSVCRNAGRPATPSPGVTRDDGSGTVSLDSGTPVRSPHAHSSVRWGPLRGLGRPLDRVRGASVVHRVDALIDQPTLCCIRTKWPAAAGRRLGGGFGLRAGSRPPGRVLRCDRSEIWRSLGGCAG